MPTLSEARVLVLMPARDTVPVETMSAFTNMIVTAAAQGLCCGFTTIQNTYIDLARDELVRTALNHPSQPSHVLWVDSDMVLPADTIPRLLAHGKQVVGGLYHQRLPPHTPIVYDLPLSYVEPAEGLSQVGGMGLGCCLVETDVYRKMAVEDERWHRVTEVGEDAYWFARCAEIGVEVWLDATLEAGHVASHVVTRASRP